MARERIRASLRARRPSLAAATRANQEEPAEPAAADRPRPGTPRRRWRWRDRPRARNRPRRIREPRLEDAESPQSLPREHERRKHEEPGDDTWNSALSSR